MWCFENAVSKNKSAAAYDKITTLINGLCGCIKLYFSIFKAIRIEWNYIPKEQPKIHLNFFQECNQSQNIS